MRGHIGAGHGLCRRNPALNCALAVGQFVHLVDERATSALKTALTDLAGNLIRVVRGAGKADRIANQVNAFEDAFIGYRDATGRSPDSMVLGELLQYQEPDAIRDDGGGGQRGEEAQVLLLWREGPVRRSAHRECGLPGSSPNSRLDTLGPTQAPREGAKRIARSFESRSRKLLSWMNHL